MAPSPQQPLNGQAVQRISGLLNFRCGTWNIGSICRRGMEVCQELRKKKMDFCCLQEVRHRTEGAWFFGAKGRRHKLWWSGNDEGVREDGILLKKELLKNVVEVRRREKMMAIVLVFNLELVRIICAYAPQSGRTMKEKNVFYHNLAERMGNAKYRRICFSYGALQPTCW